MICYWATIELGITIIKLEKRLDMTLAAISYAIKRGETIAKEMNIRGGLPLTLDVSKLENVILWE